MQSRCVVLMMLGASLSLSAEARMLQKTAGRGIFETVGDALGSKEGFNPIDIMRGELCELRGIRIQHKKCMEWGVKKCKDPKASSGTGICSNLRAHVKEECQREEHKHKEKACDYARELGIEVQKKEEEPQKVEQKMEEDKPRPVQDEQQAPAPAPPQAPPAPSARAPLRPPPAPAPAKEEEEGDKPLIPKAGDAIPGGYQEPKPGAKLQAQGFRGKKVRHKDGETATDDWGKEYGHKAGQQLHNSGHSSGSAWPYLIASLALLIARLS